MHMQRIAAVRDFDSRGEGEGFCPPPPPGMESWMFNGKVVKLNLIHRISKQDHNNY